MGHQVDLQVARWGPVPVVVGPYRHLAPHGLATPPTATTPSSGPNGLQQPVQGGCAGGEQPFPDQGVQLQVTVALHGFHQVRQRGMQALASDAVRSFPHHYHRLTDGFIVDASSRQRDPLFLLVLTASQ